jgi:hypothetical protein
MAHSSKKDEPNLKTKRLNNPEVNGEYFKKFAQDKIDV